MNFPAMTLPENDMQSRVIYETPLGRKLEVVFEMDRILSSQWLDSAKTRIKSAKAHDKPFAKTVADQLSSYFRGTLVHFNLPLQFCGTPFEIAVWESVYRIPFGMMVSYAEVARAVNRPGAHRGVARAMAQLDFALFVPAHRVIGADGKIKGLEPGSMRVKLFEFENAIIKAQTN